MSMWEWLSPLSIPGFILYSFLAYVISLYFARWAAPIMEEATNVREKTRKKIVATRELKEKEAKEKKQ